MKTTIAVLCILLSLSARTTCAQDKPQPPVAHGGHEPPPQAYEDCKDKKAGDTVQHTTPEGKVPATCIDSPKGMVARPNQPHTTGHRGQKRMPSSAGHEPPPQAYEDCKGKKAGDKVQHTTPEGKVPATCSESPKGLVARPDHPHDAGPKT